MTVCWNRSPRTFSFDSEKTGSLPSRDGPRHDRHEAHQRQCNTEDDHKAGGVGDESHERRTRKHAEVADGRHRRHGEAQGHELLAGRSREKHGHDIRNAETDHRKSGERRPCPRRGDHQPEPGGGAQASVQENAGIAERLHNAVAEQAPNGHGYGETRESQTCAGGFRTALGGHEQRAPEACRIHRWTGIGTMGIVPVTVTCSVGPMHMPESTALLYFWV